MTVVKVLLKFLEKDFLAKVFLLLLLYSLLPLCEVVLLLYLGGVVGKYLTLACAASTGLIGVILAVSQFKSVLKRLEQKIKGGLYPGKEFMSIMGIFAGGILLLTPGFITDFLGILLFMPFFRLAVGGFITRRMEKQLKEVYEYLRLYEL